MQQAPALATPTRASWRGSRAQASPITRTFVHHPILEARHWGIMNGQDVEKGAYHRTHSAYAVAAFHEALRITLQQTVAQRAKEYTFHEAALRDALTAMGCEV